MYLYHKLTPFDLNIIPCIRLFFIKNHEKEKTAWFSSAVTIYTLQQIYAYSKKSNKIHNTPEMRQPAVIVLRTLDPWLCVPAFQRVCLYIRYVYFSFSTIITLTAIVNRIFSFFRLFSFLFQVICYTGVRMILRSKGVNLLQFTESGTGADYLRRYRWKYWDSGWGCTACGTEGYKIHKDKEDQKED